MIIFGRYSTGAFLVMAASTLPFAAQAQDAVYDVAGVKIGMTPDSVEAEMAKRGYKLVPKGVLGPQKGPSFDDKLAASNGASERAQARSVMRSFSFENGDQRILITFVPFPSGPKVDRLSYYSSNLADGCVNFIKQARAKYGPDKYGYSSSAQWQDRPSVNGNPSVGTIKLDASCGFKGKLSMRRSGSLKEIKQLILSKSKGVPRDF